MEKTRTKKDGGVAALFVSYELSFGGATTSLMTAVPVAAMP